MFGKTIEEIQTGMDRIRNGQMLGQGNASTGLSSFIQSLKGVNNEIAQLKTLTKDEARSYFSNFIEASKNGKQATADFLDGLETTDKTMAGYLRTVKDGEPVFQDYQKYCDNLVASNKKVSASSKVAALGMKALATVGNMLAGMAISWAVTKLIEGIDNLANSTEHCAKRVNDLMSSYENALNMANTNAKKIDEIADRYEKLSRGVDGLGQNVSLANDEFEEYNSLTNEIAEMFPTLVQGYTEEGNAILNLKGNVEQLRDAYKEAQDEAYKLLITDGGDIVDNWKNTNKTPFINTFFDGYINRDVGKGISKKEAVRELEYFSNMSFKEFVKAQSKNPSSSLSYLHKALDFSFDTYTDEEEFEKAKKQARVLIKKYNLEIESELKKVRSLANAYLVTDDRYKNLDDKELKNAASIIVNSLNENIASQFEKDTDVGDYVQNILDIIASDKGVQEALVGLFTTNFSEMSIEDAQPIVDAYINSIAKALDREDDIPQLKIELGFEAYDRSRLENSLKKISGSGTSYANYGEYKFAEAEQKRLEEYTKDFTVAEQELWLKATNGAQSASEAIRLYEEAVAEASEAMEGLFTEAQIKRLDEYQSKIKDLADSYSKLLSGNYSKSDIIDILKSLSEKGVDISTVDSVNELKGLIKYSTIATDDLEKLIVELGITPGSDLADFLRDMTYETLRVDSAFEGLSNRLSGLKNGYTTLKDAIDEYNKSGKFTAETFDALMNMDYENLFSVLNGGKIEIDKEGIRKELLGYIADVRSTLIDEETNYVGVWTPEVQEDYRTKKQLLDDFEKYVRSSGFSLDDIFGAGDSSSTSDFSEQIDWAANSVSNLELNVNKLENDLENTKVWDKQIEKIEELNSALSDLETGYGKQADVYWKEFEEILNSGKIAELGLTDEFRNKIMSDDNWDYEDFIDENVASGEEGTRQQVYNQVQDAIDSWNRYNDAEQNKIEIKTKVDDNNDQIKEIRDKQYQLNWDTVESKQQTILNDIDYNGGKGTAKQYDQLIAYEQQLMEMEQERLKELESTLQELEPSTDEYKEQVDLINESKNRLAECKREIKDWGLEKINLLLDYINNKLEEINEQIDANQDAIDAQDRFISGAIGILNQEIEVQEELRDAIQDKIDALQKENDEHERALALEKAKYELERARSQRTVKLYSGEDRGFIYTQDEEAVRDAQENLDQLEYEAMIHALEQQVEHYDKIIEDLNEIKNAWSEIASKAQELLDIQYTLSVGGEGIRDAILGGTYDVQGLTNSYQNLLAKGEALESQKQTWEDFYAAIETAANKFEWGITTYDECFQEISGVVTEYSDLLQITQDEVDTVVGNILKELGILLDPIEETKNDINALEKGTEEATDAMETEIQNTADVAKTEASDAANEITETLRTEAEAQKEVMDQFAGAINETFATMVNQAVSDAGNAFNSLAEMITSLAESVNNQIAGMVSQAQNNIVAMQSLAGLAKNLNSDILESAKKSVQVVTDTKVSHSSGRQNIELKANGGMLTGKDKSLDKLAHSLGEDHITLLGYKEGERVLTPVQNEIWEKLYENAGNLMMNPPNFDFATMKHLNIPMNRAANSNQVTIGDIHLHEVQNVTDFAKALQKHLPGISVQYNGKH